MKALVPAVMLVVCCITISDAQSGKQVKKNTKKTTASKARKHPSTVTPEIKRENAAEEKVQATIIYLDSSFKKDRVKSVMSSSMVFGRKGEAYIVNDELKTSQPDVQRFIYNYAEKNSYIVAPKDKTAMKMPPASFQKMIEKAARKDADEYSPTPGTRLKATDEWASFGGYNARKFVGTQANGNTIEQWVCGDLRLSLADSYLTASRVAAYKFPEHAGFENLAGGFVVRLVQLDKKGRIKSTRTISRFEKGVSEDRYFDLTDYKITDMLSGL